MNKPLPPRALLALNRLQRREPVRDLTPLEVAVYLQVTPKALADWRYEGRGPKFRRHGPGRKSPVRYPAAYLALYLAGCVLDNSEQKPELAPPLELVEAEFLAIRGFVQERDTPAATALAER